MGMGFRWMVMVSGCLCSGIIVASPLVSVDWLDQHSQSDHLVLLDFQSKRRFQQAHIPGSVNTDYGSWRVTNADGLGKMLPTPSQLNTLIGSLGIGQDSTVVIVPFGKGAGDMAAAARIYWTLYVAGLERIKILDGGLLSWYERFGDRGLSRGLSVPEPRVFQTQLRQEHILTMTLVEDALKHKHAIVDARSPMEYYGVVAGAANERPGSLPTAVNLPYDRLMRSDERGLLDVTQLKAQFQAAGIPLEGSQLSYCHTGHRTSLVWLVSHEILGNKAARLYDGSTLEWSSSRTQPLIIPKKSTD